MIELRDRKGRKPRPRQAGGLFGFVPGGTGGGTQPSWVLLEDGSGQFILFEDSSGVIQMEID